MGFSFVGLAHFSPDLHCLLCVFLCVSVRRLCLCLCVGVCACVSSVSASVSVSVSVSLCVSVSVPVSVSLSVWVRRPRHRCSRQSLQPRSVLPKP